MNVGLDLRLVDTKTLEVVDVVSYQKQIVARQLQAGIFDVLGTHVLTAGIGESALEPIQLAARAVIERAVLEMVSRLYGVGPTVCRNPHDPLDDGKPSDFPEPDERTLHTAYGPRPAAVEDRRHYSAMSNPPPTYGDGQRSYSPPAYSTGNDSYPPRARSGQPPYAQSRPQEKSYEDERKEPYRWYSAVDRTGGAGLRGGLD